MYRYYFCLNCFGSTKDYFQWPLGPALSNVFERNINKHKLVNSHPYLWVNIGTNFAMNTNFKKTGVSEKGQTSAVFFNNKKENIEVRVTHTQHRR